jgi:hypothetical protein
MPRPMKPTGRVALLAVLAAALVGSCTGGGNPQPTATTTAVVPTPAETFTGAPGTAVYSYANEGLLVTVRLDGSVGTLEVENDTDSDLEAPDVYVLDASDGHEIDGDVLASAPVAAGQTATFDVSIDRIGVDDIGLLVLLFGADNYGAFVRTG